jgi:hypothetical protein
MRKVADRLKLSIVKTNLTQCGQTLILLVHKIIGLFMNLFLKSRCAIFRGFIPYGICYAFQPIIIIMRTN